MTFVTFSIKYCKPLELQLFNEERPCCSKKQVVIGKYADSCTITGTAPAPVESIKKQMAMMVRHSYTSIKTFFKDAMPVFFTRIVTFSQYLSSEFYSRKYEKLPHIVIRACLNTTEKKTGFKV